MRKASIVFTCAALWLWAATSPLPAADAAPRRLRLYTIGNSLTDHLNHDAFAKALAACGWDATVAKHMIPGSPLFLLWRTCESGQNSGFTMQPYGASWHALDNYEWDAVTLQPFDRGLNDLYAGAYIDGKPVDPGSDPQGDIVYAQKFMDRIWARNPAARVYIYARNPRMTVGGKSVSYDKDNYGKSSDDPNKITDYSRLDPWEERWQNPPKNWDGGMNPEGREYFETLTRCMRNLNRGRPIYLIPVGHVMSALGRKIEAGEVPALTSVFDLYNDAIHLGPDGRYLVACTFYAAICRESPAGLPCDGYGVSDAGLAEVIRQTAWEVVRKHELAGIASATE
jgi:hypothetical protein